MGYIRHRSDESIEDYLETILMLQKSNGYVRSIDIANELNYTKASVSVAMKSLREKEYITMADNGHISLTDTGLQRAQSVLERHLLLENWLLKIGVSKDSAFEDACKIEHDLSEETFAAIKAFLNKNGIE
ncbi:MAG: metal-dependent transcriptional regulator [Eubacteriales bacterium]|nr:metal-dependent transcriptional regulator [Eubacteriales bacterium]